MREAADSAEGPDATTGEVARQPTSVQGDELAIHQSDLGATYTLKGDTLFLLTDEAGNIPAQHDAPRDNGLGLYFHDMRHLDESVLLVNGLPLTPLLVSDDLGFRGVRELTNPDLPFASGILHKETIGVHVETTLGDTFQMVLRFRNFGRLAAELEVTQVHDAHFDDMFTLRGLPAGRRGTLHPPEAHGDTLRFRYDGADGHRRTTALQFTPPPARFEGRRAISTLRLGPARCTRARSR